MGKWETEFNSNLLGDVWSKQDNKWTSIAPTYMITAIKATITKLDLKTHCITPNLLVGVHSLCMDGAMAMKLNGTTDTQPNNTSK